MGILNYVLIWRKYSVIVSSSNSDLLSLKYFQTWHCPIYLQTTKNNINWQALYCNHYLCSHINSIRILFHRTVRPSIFLFSNSLHLKACVQFLIFHLLCVLYVVTVVMVEILLCYSTTLHSKCWAKGYKLTSLISILYKL
jgi:hypothetical protein